MNKGDKVKIFHNGRWTYGSIDHVTYYPTDRWQDTPAFDRFEVAVEKFNTTAQYIDCTPGRKLRNY